MKQKKYWIWIAAALVAAALVILLVLLGRNDEGSHAVTEIISAGPTPDNPYDDKGFLKDSLPADLNYKNETVRVLTWAEHKNTDWYAADLDGEILSQAKEARKDAVEKRLGVRLELMEQAGAWNDCRSFADALEKGAEAGNNAYDLVCQFTPAAGVGITRGLFADLTSLEYPDLNNPWWPAKEESVAVQGKIYAAAGDLSISATEETQCILQNTTLAASVNIRNTEKEVTDRTWTLDRLMTLIREAKCPDNPDGSSAYRFTVGSREYLDSVLYAGGASFAVCGADGLPALSEELSSPDFAAFLKDWQSLVNAPYSFLKNIGESNGFARGTVLFHVGKISEIRNYLQGTDFTVTVLPFPLRDGNQAAYHTVSGLWTSLYSVPAQAENREMSGAVLEALGSYGYRTLLPAYRKSVFAGNRLSHSANTAMLQVLHDTLTLDYARLQATGFRSYNAMRSIPDGAAWETLLPGVLDAWKDLPAPSAP